MDGLSAGLPDQHRVISSSKGLGRLRINGGLVPKITKISGDIELVFYILFNIIYVILT